MQLKSLVADAKETTLEFPGIKGFKVRIANISRVSSQKITKESMVMRLDKASRSQVEELDSELFASNFSKAAIKGWSGLKYRDLEELMVVDLSEIEDLDAELEYTQENAEVLMGNSVVFNSWITDTVFSLATFRTAK